MRNYFQSNPRFLFIFIGTIFFLLYGIIIRFLTLLQFFIFLKFIFSNTGFYLLRYVNIFQNSLNFHFPLFYQISV